MARSASSGRPSRWSVDSARCPRRSQSPWQRSPSRPPFAGLHARGDPVPRRPRGEQRPGLVPAAEGRVRAAAEGADGGDDRGARRAARGARRPDAGRPEAVAVPDLPRHPVQQGQVAVQGPPRRELPVAGRRRARPARRAAPTTSGRTATAATSTSSRARCTPAAGCGRWRSRRIDAFRAAVRDDPERVRAALEDPGVRRAAWGEARPHDELKRFPPGYPAGPPAGPTCSSGRTSSSGGACPTTRCSRPTCPTGSPRATRRAAPVFRFLSTLT